MMEDDDGCGKEEDRVTEDVKEKRVVGDGTEDEVEVAADVRGAELVSREGVCLSDEAGLVDLL